MHSEVSQIMIQHGADIQDFSLNFQDISSDILVDLNQCLREDRFLMLVLLRHFA